MEIKTLEEKRNRGRYRSRQKPGGDKNPERKTKNLRGKETWRKKKPEGKIKHLRKIKHLGKIKHLWERNPEEGSTNNGIGWGENHLWGKDEDVWKSLNKKATKQKKRRRRRRFRSWIRKRIRHWIKQKR
nr:hypothetical protein [Mycoplasmopsis bovis]